VEFENEDAIPKAIALTGTMLHDRPIKVRCSVCSDFTLSDEFFFLSSVGCSKANKRSTFSTSWV